MTWLLRVLFVLLPVVGWAEGTRVDRGGVIGGIRLEVTLTPGLGIEQPHAHIDFRNFSDDDTVARPEEEKIPLMLTHMRRSGRDMTYVFDVPEEARPRAMAFYDRTNGVVPTFVPALNLCLTAHSSGRETISYRLYRPGFGSTPMQRQSAAGMQNLMAKLDPCPTDPTAR